MYKIRRKLILLVFFSLCIFILISSASASNYYVNNDTTHKNIADWMKNNAKSGDKLIFNTTTYELTDKLVINKPIKIVSYKKTQINFRKNNDMFLVKKHANFTGLDLNHYGESNSSNLYFYSAIKLEYESYIKVTLKNTNITTYVINTSYNTTESASGISFYKWIGSLNNCNISVGSASIYDSYGIEGYYGKFNITNSKLSSTFSSIHIRSSWQGNIKNSTIISIDSSGIYCENWKGKIHETEIIAKGEYFNYTYRPNWVSAAVNLGFSKGSIEYCIIKATNSLAVKATADLKIINSNLSSKKGFPKIYRHKADLTITEVKPTYYKLNYPFWHTSQRKYDYYYVTIKNDGYKSSKSCFLSFKTMKTYKKYYVKSLKPKQKTIIKIKFFSIYMTQYMNTIHPKIFKIDCNNQIKEDNKQNNIYNLDKHTYKNI